MSLKPMRSALYMPGSNARALEKAKTLKADVVILDLEDAVAPEQKEMARAQIVAAVTAGGFGSRQVVVRVNALDTIWGMADVAAVVAAGPDAILLPKPNCAADIARANDALARGGVRVKTRLWAMIETPMAILNIAEIAATARHAGSRLDCFVLGTNDLVKETRAELDASRTAALFWLSSAVTAGRAYGISVMDGVFNAFKDLDGLARECEQGRALGFDGKTLIHPIQIDIANKIFAPSADEVAMSRKIIAAFAQPENRGKGVITLDGKMVELLHAEIAQRTVAVADAIAARGQD